MSVRTSGTMLPSPTNDVLSKPLQYEMMLVLHNRDTDRNEQIIMKLDLRDQTHRKQAIDHMTNHWSDYSSLDISIMLSNQLLNNLIFPIIQYQIITQNTLLYHTLSSIHFNLLKITKNDVAAYEMNTGHFLDIAMLVYTDKLLLRHLFRRNIKTSKLFLSIIACLLLDRFNQLKEDEYSSNFLRILNETAVYWKKQHFRHLIENDLCQIIKKYITKLRVGRKMNLLFCGIDPGEELKNSMNNLMHITCCHLYRIYGNNRNDPILKSYQIKLNDAFFSKSNTRNIMTLKLAYTILERYHTYKAFKWCMDFTFSMYKDRKIVVCGWILCSKSNRNEVIKMYKCKGCKLMLYCCRNHQKKHWKYIHAQQCLKMY